MNRDSYPVVSDKKHLVYEFLSEGPKGTIRKTIYFKQLSENQFNLGFGDWNESLQKMDDRARSNNDDRDKVIATVAITILDFLKYYPRALIIAKGSTAARTRLYQMGIVANWHEISKILEVEGLTNKGWEPFEKNKNYQAFFVRAKKTLYF